MRDSFFKRGMGTQFGSEWRYKRQEMGRFIENYQAISLPAYDLDRIVSHNGVREIAIEELATGFVYVMPVEFLPSGTYKRIEHWQEQEQYFLPIGFWTRTSRYEREPKKEPKQKKERKPRAKKIKQYQTSFFGGM